MIGVALQHPSSNKGAVAVKIKVWKVENDAFDRGLAFWRGRCLLCVARQNLCGPLAGGLGLGEKNSPVKRSQQLAY